MNEDLRQAINQFVKLAVNGGLNRLPADYRIGVNKLDDGYEIRAVPIDSAEKFDLMFGFPKLQGDDIDKMIDLAGVISLKISEWLERQSRSAGGRKSSSNMTPEQRTERAKKAVRARIDKYNQKS